jgi:hypothetical protein
MRREGFTRLTPRASLTARQLLHSFSIVFVGLRDSDLRGELKASDV